MPVEVQVCDACWCALIGVSIAGSPGGCACARHLISIVMTLSQRHRRTRHQRSFSNQWLTLPEVMTMMRASLISGTTGASSSSDVALRGRTAAMRPLLLGCMGAGATRPACAGACVHVACGMRRAWMQLQLMPAATHLAHAAAWCMQHTVSTPGAWQNMSVRCFTNGSTERTRPYVACLLQPRGDAIRQGAAQGALQLLVLALRANKVPAAAILKDHCAAATGRLRAATKSLRFAQRMTTCGSRLRSNLSWCSETQWHIHNHRIHCCSHIRERSRCL